MPGLTLQPQKRYQMPHQIHIERIDGKILVISTGSANWLLLHNEEQLAVFNLFLQGKSIEDVLSTFRGDVSDIYTVLTELEAKQFENTAVQTPQEHGLYIYLTNRCNLRCRHCYMNAGEELKDELTTNEVFQVLDSFTGAGGEVVTFTGGEPTLRPDFVKIIKRAKSNHLTTCVLSNGTLWTSQLIRECKESLDEIQISIDGFNAATYQMVRCSDCFEKVLKTVDKLLSANVRVLVSVTPLPETLCEYKEEYITFAQNLLQKYKDDKFLVKFSTELLEGREIHMSAAENAHYRDIMNEIVEECSPLSREEGFALDHRNNAAFFNCGYGGLCVASNGDVYFCNLISECARQGNIRTHSFSTLLDYSKRVREASNVNNLIPCRECPLKYICGGGCRVQYFKELVDTIIEQTPNIPHFTREIICTPEYKKRLYQLMISSNRFFYRQVTP
jgi:radical SAM protein with 4Fe4S-binding SPASM domain